MSEEHPAVDYPYRMPADTYLLNPLYMPEQLGWHSIPYDQKMTHDSPPSLPIQRGYTYIQPGLPIPCAHGLHASPRIIDALPYAASPVFCYVRSHGVGAPDPVKVTDTKRCTTHRTVLWLGDLSPQFYALVDQVLTWLLDGSLQIPSIVPHMEDRWHHMWGKRGVWLRGHQSLGAYTEVFSRETWIVGNQNREPWEYNNNHLQDIWNLLSPDSIQALRGATAILGKAPYAVPDVFSRGQKERWSVYVDSHILSTIRPYLYSQENYHD